MRTFGIVLAAFLGATACGPLNEGSAAKGFLGALRQTVAGKTAAPQVKTPPLTQAQVDANPGAYILVTAYGGNSVASLVKAGTNGSRETWLSADGVSITLDDGIMVATRGLPRDLIAARVTGLESALAAGSGSATRVHEILTDLDQISTELLQCSIARKGPETVEILGNPTTLTRVEEACKGKNLVFTNTYWLNGVGAIKRSSQVVSPATGFLQIEVP